MWVLYALCATVSAAGSVRQLASLGLQIIHDILSTRKQTRQPTNTETKSVFLIIPPIPMISIMLILDRTFRNAFSRPLNVIRDSISEKSSLLEPSIEAAPRSSQRDAARCAACNLTHPVNRGWTWILYLTRGCSGHGARTTLALRQLAEFHVGNRF